MTKRARFQESLIGSVAILGSFGWLVASAFADNLPKLDKNGVTMIYPTKDGKETYMESVQDIHDIFVPISDNGDGTYTIDAMTTYPIKFNGARMGLYAPNEGKWHNQEITGFFRTLNHMYPDTGITLYGRSFGRHSELFPCLGTGYKGTIPFDGSKTFIKKEVWHNGGYTGELATNNNIRLGGIRDKWIGQKLVIYDITPDIVKTELYINPNADGTSWFKVSEVEDSGGLFGANPPPGCLNPATGHPRRQDEILTSAYDGRDAVFRIDNAIVQFTGLSAREIIPPV